MYGLLNDNVLSEDTVEAVIKACVPKTEYGYLEPSFLLSLLKVQGSDSLVLRAGARDNGLNKFFAVMASSTASTEFGCAYILVDRDAKKVDVELWVASTYKFLHNPTCAQEQFELQLTAWSKTLTVDNADYSIDTNCHYGLGDRKHIQCGIHVSAHGISVMAGQGLHKGKLDNDACNALRQLFRTQLVNLTEFKDKDPVQQKSKGKRKRKDMKKTGRWENLWG